MPRLRRSLAFGIVIAAMTGFARAEEPREGLVVIEAPSAGSLAEAGLQPGDVLLSWQRSSASGQLRWPSGLAEAETEQAPRGVVRLAGRRGERPMTWQMPAVRWNLHTRPALSPHLLTLYREGAERAAARDLETAAASWLVAVDVSTRADDTPRTAWFLGELGRIRAAASQWGDADRAYEGAIRRVEGGGMAAHLLREWGGTLIRRELWDRAESCFQRSLALAPPGSLTASRDLALLASIATHRGDLDRAERLYKQALVTRRQVTVIGPYFSRIIREEIAGFGIPDWKSAEETRELRRRLDELREKLLTLAGVPRKEEGSTRTAAAPPKKPEPNPLETLQKALAKAEREAPGSLDVSDRWQDLGAFAFQEGDLVAAEIAWLHALDLREKLAPGTQREARTLHHLGEVHAKAGRKQAATSFLCRAAGALDRMGRKAPSDLGYDEECLAALVDSRRPDEAFQALERSRVRGTAASKAVDADRVRTLERLGRLSTSRDRDEVDILASYLAELQDPGPRDLEALRADLLPGTLLLAWSIGDERSFLFLVRPAKAAGPGVEVVPLRARAGDLRERVLAFARSAAPNRAEAVALYRELLGPTGEPVAAAERLLLLPDNVLKALPFGTLVQKPLETATSATAWVAARKDVKDLADTTDTASP